MANEKDLKNLNAEEKETVAGGDIYYSSEGGRSHYFVPNPTKEWNGQYYLTVRGKTKGIECEANAGRGTTVHRYKTIAEAQAAAAEEGLRIAAEQTFGTFDDT